MYLGYKMNKVVTVVDKNHERYREVGKFIGFVDFPPVGRLYGNLLEIALESLHNNNKWCSEVIVVEFEGNIKYAILVSHVHWLDIK
jgi:hypothetical protein